MGFSKLLLNICLILAAITASSIADSSEIIYRLPTDIKPVHYNIRLIPRLDEGNFYGEINVSVVSSRNWRNISLHSQDLEINETATTLISYNGIIYKPIEHTYDNETDILTLHFDDVLSYGYYTLDMKFAGNFSEAGFLRNGFMKVPYADQEGDDTLAVTFLQPSKARRMFPCWDEPESKATFNISVMHHQKYRVLSNMPVRERFMEQGSMMWTHFDITPKMSTYLVGIVISNFVRVGNADETVNVWCRPSLTPQAKFAHSIAESVASLLVEYTKISRKVPKMDHVMVSNYPVHGMENWGLIIYNESNVVYDDSTDPTYRRKDVALLVAHELVHQWFGNLVTPKWWSYLWLSEGFAAFFEAYFVDKIFEEWRTMDFLVIKHLHESLTIDVGLMDSVTLKFDGTFDYDDLFINEVYDKAPVLLRMLHHSITDEIFQKGIVKYLNNYQFGSVIPDNLWSAMQSALNDQSYVPHEGFKIKTVMDTWINQNRYPVLNVIRNYETGEVTITQQCFYTTNDKCMNSTWWIPITFATQSNPDFSKTVPNHWMGSNQTRIPEVHSSDWIIVNVQQTAYCRVNYDITNWQKIIRYLNSEEYSNIHVLNRAQIIDDAFTFVLKNQIHSSLFIDLINYLSRERDYVAWYPMFRVLKRTTQYFSLIESEYFKSRTVRIFDGLLQDLGYEENPNDDDMTKMLRQEATNWACTIGHTECKRTAAIKLSEHLADSDNHKIPQWWQEWTYYFGLTVANRTIWDKMLELYQRKPDKKFWKILSAPEDPDIIINYLNIIASNTTLFHEEDHPFIFKIILEKHARNNLILDYVLQNFEIIKPRVVASNVIIKNILWNIFSNEQLYKVKKFSEINFRQDPDTLFEIEDLIEMRKDNLQLAVDNFKRRYQTN